ncbi:hypothetical protein J6590_064515 [Homalodisca vitripennis]|nr:hypothetical protein J6590_064515 [Homalodisca vitripennis]
MFNIKNKNKDEGICLSTLPTIANRFKDSVVKMGTDEVDVVIATAAYVALRKRKREIKRKKTYWVHKVFRARDEKGEFHTHFRSHLCNTLPAPAVPLPPTGHVPRIALASDRMKTKEARRGTAGAWLCVNRESAVSCKLNGKSKQRGAWLLLVWVTAKGFCLCKQLACTAIDGGSPGGGKHGDYCNRPGSLRPTFAHFHRPDPARPGSLRPTFAHCPRPGSLPGLPSLTSTGPTQPVPAYSGFSVLPPRVARCGGYTTTGPARFFRRMAKTSGQVKDIIHVEGLSPQPTIIHDPSGLSNRHPPTASGPARPIRPRSALAANVSRESSPPGLGWAARCGRWST